MAKKKNICPIEILCVIIDRKLEKETEEVQRANAAFSLVQYWWKDKNKINN